MAIAQNAEQGAAAGSVAGPYGAAIGAAGGVLAGLIGSGQGESTIDMGQLLATIQGAGQYQQQIINQLPANVQAQLQQYIQQTNAAGAAYQGNVQQQGANYQAQAGQIYGPNSDAANAEKNADKTATYSTVPGTQDAIRNALAATGGLERGQAGVALAQPYVQAAQTYAGQAAGVNAKQTASGQNAQMQALTTVNSMDTTMFQNLFGMSKEQAQQILTSGNQALQTQLADLINQSNTQTSQTLGAQGIQAQNGYQNALQQAGNQNAIYNGLATGGLDMAASLPGTTGGGAGSTGLPAGADVTSPYYQMNSYANTPAGV